MKYARANLDNYSSDYLINHVIKQIKSEKRDYYIHSLPDLQKSIEILNNEMQKLSTCQKVIEAIKYKQD